MKSRELRSTCCKDLSSVLTSSVSRLSSPHYISKWSRELDTSVTHTRSSISLNFLPVRSSRPPGTESSFSLEDWQSLRLRKLVLSQTLPFSIKCPWLPFLTPRTPRSSCVQLFAHISVASQFPILVPTRVGFAFVTVPSTINSAEWDKVPPRPTCPTSTTPCTDPLCALRSRSSPTSPPYSSTFELVGGRSLLEPTTYSWKAAKQLYP